MNHLKPLTHFATWLTLLLFLTGCFALTWEIEEATLPQAPAESITQPPDQIDGLPVITRAELPPEAHTTLDLIHRGGPFPYDRDGITFQNRERLLPIHPRGYYREYTVPTPGLSHRGARRIVMGDGGEFYYTADHYESFHRIWDP